MKASQLIEELAERIARRGDHEVEVSVDVSTGEHDAGNRIFATPIEVMEGNPIMILTEPGEPNFQAPGQRGDL